MPVPDRHALISKSLLREDAFQALRDAIVDGTFAPGEKLNDAELGQWLGISRTPVREALMRLEQMGLVLSRPGRSTLVAPLDVRATSDAQLVAASLHELAMRSCARELTSDEIGLMRAANDRFKRALKARDVEQALAADDDFHDVAVRASGNHTIRSMLEQVTPALRRVERLRFATLAGRASVSQHARIIELCERGEADQAGLAVRENWLTLQPLLESAAARQRSADTGDKE
jgi:DNA-binding GntR family transcriptional regulator